MSEKRINTSEMVYRSIEEKIYRQEWTPGMKITPETQLAQELGVSRISVREAIEKMAALNILTKKQGGGTFVNDLSPAVYLSSLLPMVLLKHDSLLEVVEFRKIMEVDSARLCAEKCDESTIIELEEAYGVMCENNNKSTVFAEADHRFHMIIAKGSKNSLVIKVNSVLTDIWRYQQEEINRYLGPSGGVQDHGKILEAIKQRDGQLAALFMDRHLQRTYREIKNVIENPILEENIKSDEV